VGAFVDLEDAWNSAPPAERVQYLASAWRAADHEGRSKVLREDARLWLEAAWRACHEHERRGFVAGWLR
jgi:hypothetical protein